MKSRVDKGLRGSRPVIGGLTKMDVIGSSAKSVLRAVYPSNRKAEIPLFLLSSLYLGYGVG
jgi:hypothetical protein